MMVSWRATSAPSALLNQVAKSLLGVPLNVRPLNVRPLKVRPLNVRPLNVRPLKVRPLNVRPLNVKPSSCQTPTAFSGEPQPATESAPAAATAGRNRRMPITLCGSAFTSKNFSKLTYFLLWTKTARRHTVGLAPPWRLEETPQ